MAAGVSCGSAASLAVLWHQAYWDHCKALTSLALKGRLCSRGSSCFLCRSFCWHFLTPGNQTHCVSCHLINSFAFWSDHRLQCGWPKAGRCVLSSSQSSSCAQTRQLVVFPELLSLVLTSTVSMIFHFLSPKSLTHDYILLLFSVWLILPKAQEKSWGFILGFVLEGFSYINFELAV